MFTRIFSLAALALSSVSAFAAAIDSRYQGIIADDPSTAAVEGPCRQVEWDDESDYVKFDCGRMGDYRLFVIEADIRPYLEIQHRNGTTFQLPLMAAVSGAFSTLPARVIEWRGEAKNGRFEPFALIARVQNVEPSCTPDLCVMQALTVSKVSPQGGCHMDFVNVLQVPNSNEAARAMADSRARSFVCPAE